MKKLILPIILFIMFIPFYVNAETCDTDKISISSITVESKSDNVEEIEEASVNGKIINLNLSMSEVGDDIEYKIIVKNDSNEDYELDTNSFNISSDYIDYTLKSNDNSNIVNSNSSKTVYLKVEYKNEVPEEAFESGTYSDNKTMTVNLSTSDIINVPDTLKNPNTRVQSYVLTLFIILLISITIYVLLKKKKYTKFMILVIGTAIIIPIGVYAICKENIEINSNIKITRSVPVTETIYWALQDNNMDDLNETLVISSEEVDGILKGNIPGDSTFISYSLVPWITSNYYYDNNNLSYNVTNVKIEGIVAPTSTAYWFYSVGYGASTFEADLSNLVTNNVTDMSNMFHYAGMNATTWSIGNIGNWDTSQVTNMASMFAVAGNRATNFNLDLSNWDTLNVTDMSSMLTYAGQSATTWSIGNIGNWDTSQVTNMANMFDSAGSSSTSWSIGDINNWDTSNVTYMEAMFRCVGQNATTFSLDLSNWDTSKVTNMSSLFLYAGYNSTSFNLNLSNWDTSNVVNMSSMFNSAGRNATTWSIGDISNWDTSKVTDMRYMFDYAGNRALTFNLDLSSWDTSQVTMMSDIFRGAGHDATTFSLTIPTTNGNGIDNTTSRMYGKTTSISADPPFGKSFTLAN